MKPLFFVHLGIASLVVVTAEKIGDPCQAQSVVCAFGNGNTPLYLKCDQGKYIQQSCPDDSICIGAQDNTVLCGYGRTPANVTISKPNTIISSADKQETIIPPFTSSFSVSSSTSATSFLAGSSSNVASSTFPPLPNQFASQIKTLSGNPHPTWSSQKQPQQQQLSSKPPYSLVHQPSNGDVVAVPVRPPTSTPLMTQKFPEPHWTADENKVEPIPVSVVPTFLDSPGAAFAPSTDRIGGIKAQRILSVIGNILMSQHAKPAAPTQTPLMLKNSNNSPVSLPPKPAASFPPVMECSPGQFVCEAHGARPLYFACDTVGMALPATCGNEEVCYQYGKSIICAPPGWRNLPPLLPPSPSYK